MDASVSPIVVTVICMAVCYLVCGIPFGLIIGRLSGNVDIRKAGSGNIGTTNALRVAGPKVAALTLLFDCLKGVLGVLIGRCIWLRGGRLHYGSRRIGRCVAGARGIVLPLRAHLLAIP